MNKTVALIACSNGYGHTRRLLLLAQALKSKSVAVEIFAPSTVVKKLEKTEGLSSFKVVDFDSKTRILDWKRDNAKNWYKKLPDLSAYDIVVSDNLIEILKVRPDAWLSGSFFWHDSLDYVSKETKEQSEGLLLKYKPRMISSKIFSSEELANYTRLYEVGVYAKNVYNIVDYTIKKSLLISCGGGGGMEDVTRKFVLDISKIRITVFKVVYVEPNVFPKNAPEWMKPASFSENMYLELIAAVIRPGVGTVTNSLLSGVKIFSFYENSMEMKRNAEQLDCYGVGVNAKSIRCAWNKAVSYVKDDKNKSKYVKDRSLIDFDGAIEAADIVLGNN